MLVERTKKEVIIRLPASINTDDLQDFLNYAQYKELTSTIHVRQQAVDKLADEVNSNWWAKNKKRFN
jgi:dihydroneopterin aldolase